MEAKITTEVQKFFQTHDTTQIITTIMSVALRDASNNPGLYKSTDTGDDLTDLVNFMSKLGLLLTNEQPECIETLMESMTKSFMNIASKRLDVEDRLASQTIFEAYKTGIMTLIKAGNDASKPVDFAGIIKQVNDKLK